MKSNKNFISGVVVITMLFSINLFSQENNLSQDQILEIQDRVDAMPLFQLNARKAQLIQEAEELEGEQETSQSPARLKEISATLAVIFAELTAIETAIVTVGAAGLLGTVFDDDSRDITPPVITVLGPNPVTVERGDDYLDAGATSDGGESVSTNFGGLDTNVVGAYTITYSASDASQNTGYATRIVNVVDTTAPVVTVIGDNPATVELGDTYTDAGATTNEGTLTTSGTVDTSTVGAYTLTYTSTDASGNAGTATRTVNVTDTVAPVFTSTGNYTVNEGSTTIGVASATDIATVTISAADGGSRFEFSGGADSSSSPATIVFAPSAIAAGYNDYETIQSFGCSTGYEAGGYRIKASDGTNEVTQNICVTIVNLNDNTPEISSGATFSAAENQTAIGTVTASDADGDLNDLSFSVSGSILEINASTGVLTFATAPDFETTTSVTAVVTVSDGTNSSTQDITVTITDVDDTAPVITVTGDNPATVELGATYTDAGATASDTDDASPTVTSSGTVDTDTLGTYTITYTAIDAAGNSSTATRTVNVVDTTAPVFTSSANFSADENQTAIGVVTATDLADITFTISGSELAITSGGILTFATAPDFETKSTYTATVTATDANSNAATQDITVTVNDVGGIDDDPATGTGTSTSTGTGTGTGTCLLYTSDAADE